MWCSKKWAELGIRIGFISCIIFIGTSWLTLIKTQANPNSGWRAEKLRGPESWLFSKGNCQTQDSDLRVSPMEAKTRIWLPGRGASGREKLENKEHLPQSQGQPLCEAALASLLQLWGRRESSTPFQIKPCRSAASWVPSFKSQLSSTAPKKPCTNPCKSHLNCSFDSFLLKGRGFYRCIFSGSWLLVDLPKIRGLTWVDNLS